MKATPELLQRALRNLEMGLSPEISAKILATVRLLDEKGAEANLIDFALIEACYSDKPQSEPLPRGSIDMSSLVEGSILLLSDDTKPTIFSIMQCNDGNYFVKEDGGGQMYFN